MSKLIVPPSRLVLLFLLVVLVAFSVGAGIALYMRGSGSTDVPGMMWPNPKAITAFSLTDQHGKPFGLARIKGRWTLFFFGYTHCQDTCPQTLAMLARMHKLLAADGDAARGVQFAFISVDPARDTPALLGRYVDYFDKSFIAATAPEQELRQLTVQMGVVAARGRVDASGNYAVSHTSAILLTDPKARLVGVFQQPHAAPDLVHRLQRIRAIIGG